MKLTQRLLIIALFTTNILLINTAYAERIPGTKFSITPPKEFTLSSRFAGFEDIKTGSSILVIQIPGANYAELINQLTDEALQTRGMTVLERQTFKSSGHEGTLFKVRQYAQGVKFNKWLSYTGNNDGISTVVGSYPAAANHLDETMKKAVMSAQYIQEFEAPPFASLPFTLKETQNLKIANTITQAVFFSKNGAPQTPSLNDPIFIATRAISPVNINNLKNFATQRLYNLSNIKNIKITQEQEKTIN